MQFFVSRKRKAESPVSKHGRSGKGGRICVDGSPSGKGTLDSYLVSSQEKSSPARLSHTTTNPSPRVDAVKRSLAPVLDSSFDNEHKQHVPPDRIQKGLTDDLPKVTDEAVEKPIGENSTYIRQGVSKQFAVDFLSLYCR